MDFKAVKNQIEDFLKDYVSRKKLYISDALASAILTEGKRLRALVSVASSQAYGIPVEKAIPIASVYEIAHCATLVLDDLPSMDNEDLRHGRPTLHKQFGEAPAIIAAFNAVNARAMGLLNEYSSGHRKTKLIYEWTNTSDLLSNGQLRDVLQKDLRSLEQVIDMYSQKTGALFAAAAVSGGIMGDAKKKEIEYLRDFGNNLGIAFQIWNDRLNEKSPRQMIGMPERKEASKATVQSFCGVEGARKIKEEHEELAVAALRTLGKLERDTTSLLDLMHEIKYGQEKALKAQL